MFLNDGMAVARFDIGVDGCMVSEPCEHESFAEMIIALASIRKDMPPCPSVLMTRRFLEALVALRQAGLFDAGARPLPRQTAEAAIASVMPAGSAVSDLLVAMQEQGVLAIADDGVRPNKDWMREHPFILEGQRLSAHWIELADAAAGRMRLGELTVLGTSDQRIVFLPAAARDPERDVLLDLVQATGTSVLTSVARLLAAPPAPPRNPTAAFRGPLGRRLTAERDPKRRSTQSPTAWRSAPIEEILLDDCGSPPAALLAPGATIEIVVRSSTSISGQRHVIALDEEDIVEWCLDGSTVCWRPLDAALVTTRIDELLAAYPADTGTSPESHELPIASDALRALFVMHPAECPPRSQLPMPLHELTSADTTRWCSVRIAIALNDGVRSSELLVADNPSRGTWIFETDAVRCAARSVSAMELRAELTSMLELDARTPAGQAD